MRLVYKAKNSIFASKFKRGSDGGIGRRAGLKHQWGNPCRFDPGSEYEEKDVFRHILFYFLLPKANAPAPRIEARGRTL